MKKLTKQQKIDHEKKYVAFLKKRLDSQNYKANVTAEEYERTKEKYEKAKFLLRTLEVG